MRSLDIPAGRTVEMSPFTVDVMLTTRHHWRAGDTVPFVLHFTRSPAVRVTAEVIRPGT
jgi:copper(I)-binding protein